MSTKLRTMDTERQFSTASAEKRGHLSRDERDQLDAHELKGISGHEQELERQFVSPADAVIWPPRLFFSSPAQTHCAPLNTEHIGGMG